MYGEKSWEKYLHKDVNILQNKLELFWDLSQNINKTTLMDE